MALKLFCPLKVPLSIIGGGGVRKGQRIRRNSSDRVGRGLCGSVGEHLFNMQMVPGSVPGFSN